MCSDHFYEGFYNTAFKKISGRKLVDVVFAEILAI